MGHPPSRRPAHWVPAKASHTCRPPALSHPAPGPPPGERVQLSGFGAFDAATHCASVSAARRAARKLRQQAPPEGPPLVPAAAQALAGSGQVWQDDERPRLLGAQDAPSGPQLMQATAHLAQPAAAQGRHADGGGNGGGGIASSGVASSGITSSGGGGRHWLRRLLQLPRPAGRPAPATAPAAEEVPAGAAPARDRAAAAPARLRGPRLEDPQLIEWVAGSEGAGPGGLQPLPALPSPSQRTASNLSEEADAHGTVSGVAMAGVRAGGGAAGGGASAGATTAARCAAAAPQAAAGAAAPAAATPIVPVRQWRRIEWQEA
jgi:hypothetical protein